MFIFQICAVFQESALSARLRFRCQMDELGALMDGDDVPCASVIFTVRLRNTLRC